MNRTEALNSLYLCEIEFHRLARSSGIGAHDRDQQHVQFAIRRGYEPLLSAVEGVSAAAARGYADRLLASADTRDVLAARDSVLRLLGLSAIEQ